MGGQRPWLGLPLIALLALVYYTTPWDNYSIGRMGLWSVYGLERRSGHVFVKVYVTAACHPVFRMCGISGIRVMRWEGLVFLGKPSGCIVKGYYGRMDGFVVLCFAANGFGGRYKAYRYFIALSLISFVER